VDTRLHHLQGKAERVNDVLTVLQEFYRDELAALLCHEAGARLIRQYDVNNTYQYIINREETHLAWLGAAIAELGGRVDETDVQAPIVSQRPFQGDRAGGRSVIEQDAREAQAFVERWRPRVEAMPNARHAKMLGVILGEVLEQRRFFEQALAGRTDLLGRRAQQVEPAQGDVLPSRWIE
jgi:rubrerythrin